MGRRLMAALVVLGVLALAAASFAAPDDPPPVVNPPHGGAPTIDGGPGGRVALDGLWRFRRDPQARGMDKGYQQGRFSGPLVRVPWVPDARRIAGRAGVRNFRGTVGWYRTNVVVPTAGRYAIRFESVNHKAQVFVDGHRVATNVGEYLPFEAHVDLTPGVPHKLVVRADWRNPNQMKRDGWHRLWFNFGGVNRAVTIRPVGASEIMHPALRTRLEADGSAIVGLQVHVRNNGPARQIAPRATLKREGRTVDVAFAPEGFAPGETKILKAIARVPDPALWSPRDPQLWDYVVEVPGESSHRARVGLREVRTSGDTLLLNGRAIRLRGASIHEDVYGRGDALTPADQDRIVAGLKAINANATRSQHPIDPGLLERFDAAGIMVWQGVGPTDSPGNFTARTPAKVRVAKERVRRTLRQSQLHPSIITWNLANEVAGDGHPTGQAQYIDSMARELKQRDPSRPIALDIWGAHPPKRPSLMYRNVDMIGWTNYIGWYESPDASASQLRREIRSRLAQIRRVFPEKVIAVTEFGAEGNGRNPSTAPGGYAFQSHLIDLHLSTYAQIPHLSGALVWNLRDFAVAPSFAGGSITRVVPGIKLVRGVNQKGLYNLSNEPKPSAAAAASRFQAQAAAERP